MSNVTLLSPANVRPMLCLLALKDGQPHGWIVADSVDNLIRKCDARMHDQKKPAVANVILWLHQNRKLFEKEGCYPLPAIGNGAFQLLVG